jgi:hypothetical protein
MKPKLPFHEIANYLKPSQEKERPSIPEIAINTQEYRLNRKQSIILFSALQPA